MTSPSPASSDLEERLRSLLVHLQSEFSILERLVYKNKNQHRRCPYFQALLKVRRDVRLLLQSARLWEILNNLFPIIDGRRPAQKAYNPTRLSKKEFDAKYNYMERLLGSARLLSQMTEPLLMAATQISLLLSKSFFKSFSTTTLALLARLRVLVQQILLDVVVLFNNVACISRRKHAVKLNQQGVETFREYCPVSKDVLTLECAWEEDKFVLVEKRRCRNTDNDDEEIEDLPSETSIQYERTGLFNEDIIETSEDEGRKVGRCFHSGQQNSSEKANVTSATLTSCTFSKPERESSKKVAFIKVAKPRANEPSSKPSKKIKWHLFGENKDDPADPFLSMLTAGTNSSIF